MSSSESTILRLEGAVRRLCLGDVADMISCQNIVVAKRGLEALLLLAHAAVWQTEQTNTRPVPLD